jgi:hypothetical protein
MAPAMLETTIASSLPKLAWLWAEPDCSTDTLFYRGGVAGETE